VYGSTIFFELDLKNLPGPLPEFIPFRLFQATLNDTSRLLRASDVSRTQAQIENRFNEGQLCFAAANDAGAIVHSTWCAPGRASIDELNREILLEPDEIYLYDSYTNPDNRRKGASRSLQPFMMNALRTMGYNRILAFVRGNNVPMLQGVRPSHRKTGRLFYFRLFGGPPIILGKRERRLRIQVAPQPAPAAVGEVQVPSTPANQSALSAAAAAGSQHDSQK